MDSNDLLHAEMGSKLSLQESNSAPRLIPAADNNVIERNGNGVQRSKSFAFRAPQEPFRIEDFECEKLHGVGSYSRVVRAKKKDTGKIYALKIMDKRFIAKEKKTAYVKLERIVLDQLDHPGIIKLYFTFQDACNIYLGLESCDGGELFDQISRKSRISEDEARFYIAEIVDVLEYLHKVGLIHRDVKPENLLLTADGHLKLADFGSVKPMENTSISIIPTTSSKASRKMRRPAHLLVQLPMFRQRSLSMHLQQLETIYGHWVALCIRCCLAYHPLKMAVSGSHSKGSWIEISNFLNIFLLKHGTLLIVCWIWTHLKDWLLALKGMLLSRAILSSRELTGIMLGACWLQS